MFCCFRITLLCISLSCVFFTLGLIVYVYNYRKIKVFKVASPIFLSLTLTGCAIMYLEVSCKIYLSRPKVVVWVCVRVMRLSKTQALKCIYNAFLLEIGNMCLTWDDFASPFPWYRDQKELNFLSMYSDHITGDNS